MKIGRNRLGAWTAVLSGTAVVAVAVVASPAPSSQQALTDPFVKRFVGSGGFGQVHPDAPPETRQFGRLVGVWRTEQEVRKQDGSWVPQPSGLWIWKYILDGFAIQDLWYQRKGEVPAFTGVSGRPYLLTGLRIFDLKSGQWKVGWAANGGGRSPGADWGVLTAKQHDGQLILTGPPVESPQGRARQRVVFSDFTASSFRWTSEFSMNDGKSWSAVMRIRATRLR